MAAITRHKPGTRMSAAVVHGDTVYVAGQVADDASADLKGQAKQVLEKIEGILTACGSSKSKLLSATIWLADIRQWELMNTVWDPWIDPANPPARATVEAKLARAGILIEIAVVAGK
jgi:enamine deaminase RidA (YjgF/YER057c/UK114 family)